MREMNIRGVLIKKKWGAKYRGGSENWALTVKVGVERAPLVQVP